MTSELTFDNYRPYTEGECSLYTCVQLQIRLKQYQSDTEVREIGDLFSSQVITTLAYYGKSPSIKVLNLEYVDRGLDEHDLMTELPELLQEYYPQLEMLLWRQNYTYNENYDNEVAIKTFFEHPYIRRLKYVCVEDYQSGWQLDQKWIDLITPKDGCRLIIQDWSKYLVSGTFT